MAQTHSALLSGCHFVLGVGVQLPWSVATLILPWLATAASRPPAAPSALLDGLPSTLGLLLSLSNAAAVFAVAACVAHARPALVVPLPLSLVSCVLAFAAFAASLDRHDSSALSGQTLVRAALPLCLLLGGLTAVASLGTASLAARCAGEHSMKAFTTGQAVASLLAASLSFYAAAAVGAATSNNAQALATHAAATLATASAAMMLSCLAFAALPAGGEVVAAEDDDVGGHASGRQPNGDAGGGLTVPFLAGEDSRQEEGCAYGEAGPSEGGERPNAAAEEEGEEAPQACPARAFRLYKACLFVTYLVSFSVYPGITSFLKPAAYSRAGRDDHAALGPAPDSADEGVEAASAAVHLPGGACLRGDLLVPATFLLFAAGDMLGRVAAAALPRAQAPPLLVLSLARAVLLPALLCCNIVPPAGRWAASRLFASEDAWPFAFLALMALSNGLVTAAALNAGPGCVPPAKKGGAATAMVSWLVGGVTLGSLLSVTLSLALQRL